MSTIMKESDRGRVLIAGAGPAGLTAAYELSRAGCECLVLEKDSVVGGIARTVKHKGYYFDIGGHRFFSKIERVNKLWMAVLEEDFIRRERLSRIYYNKKFFHYPLSPLNCLLGLGVWNSFLALLSYLAAFLFPSKQEDSFEHWIRNRFGNRLYNTFFKSYTEKVWGIPCSEIGAEWAAQRIKGLSLLAVVKHALIDSRFKNKSKAGTIKSLIGQFDYPKYGPGMLWERVAELVGQNGSQVWLESQVEAILWEGSSVKALEIQRNGHRETVDAAELISSMPIGEVIQKLRPAAPPEVLDAANALRYRDFLTVALIIDRPHVFPDNWIYVHEPAVKLGRIQNFKNWSPSMVPDQTKTCLGLEYFCFEGDSLWTMKDEELIELGKRELELLGLVKSDEVKEGRVARMPKAYPIYDSAYRDSLETLRKFLDKFDNFQVIGRNGMHRYNNQDHSMLTGMLAAENILGAKHDLWKVNDEQEYHEETPDEKAENILWEKLAKSTYARMDKLGFATAVGATCAMLLFAATMMLVLRGDHAAQPTLHLLREYFIGYRVTKAGAFIGVAYAFVWGFMFGWLFSYLRNLFIAFYIYRAKRKIELLTFKDFLDHF